MKIAVAQIQPLEANILGNIALHRRLIELAAAYQVELIVFPELSLTRYEPSIAHEVALDLEDSRLLKLQQCSDAYRMTICVGAPTRSENGIVISLLVFQPEQTVQVYSKRYLHPDEERFFVPGVAQTMLSASNGSDADDKVAFAICYELSVPQHAEDAHSRGATVYIASVAKTHDGVSRAAERLAAIAQQYSMTVFMSNAVGECDNALSGGQSAVWNAKGELLASLNDVEQGLVIYDPATPQDPAVSLHWAPHRDGLRP